MSSPLAKAIEGLATELEASRDARTGRAAERAASLAALRGPLEHIGRGGMLGLLTQLPGWWEAFTRIDNPPMDGSALRCTCGHVLELRDRDLVPCECHRYFLWSRGEVFVLYGVPPDEPDDEPEP